MMSNNKTLNKKENVVEDIAIDNAKETVLEAMGKQLIKLDEIPASKIEGILAPKVEEIPASEVEEIHLDTEDKQVIDTKESIEKVWKKTEENTSNQEKKKNVVVEDKKYTKVKIGLILPFSEVNGNSKEVIEKIIKKKRDVAFCSEQFNNREINYEIVDVSIISEATAPLMDMAITEDLKIDVARTHPNSISIVIDIGGGTLDIAAMQGSEVIPASEKSYNIGLNDVLIEIAEEIEERFGLDSGSMDLEDVNYVIRYPINICSGCNTVVLNKKLCDCPEPIESKKNMLKLSTKTFDISDIVDKVLEEKSNKINSIFNRYIDSLFRGRGINKNQLERIVLAGGGSELLSTILKEKFQNKVGEYVVIEKADLAIWKPLNGLAKYTMLRDKNEVKDFDQYIFMDVGNSSTKAKLVDAENGKELKPIEMLTKISTPVPSASLTLKNLNPMMDLDLLIETVGEKDANGDGNFFVSHMANKGINIQVRDPIIPKSDDALVYTMISAAVAVLLARK